MALAESYAQMHRHIQFYYITYTNTGHTKIKVKFRQSRQLK